MRRFVAFVIVLVLASSVDAGIFGRFRGGRWNSTPAAPAVPADKDSKPAAKPAVKQPTPPPAVKDPIVDARLQKAKAEKKAPLEAP